MQAEFYKAERLKAIESRLIDALKNVDPKELTEFFAYYEGISERE